MSFHINFFASFLPSHRFLRERRPACLPPSLPPLGRRREVRVRRGGQFGSGMNGGNARTINDNYSALAAIRNT